VKPTLIIGDVHGCLTELHDLLKAAGYDNKMRLFFVGDLISRGPDSPGVLRLLRQLNAQTVLGNHERAFLKYIREGRTGNPNYEKLKNELGHDLNDFVKEMAQWPYYIENKRFLIVHGGLAPGKHPAETKPRILTNLRTWDGSGTVLDNLNDPPWYELYHDPKLVVFGHWAVRGLVIRPNAIGLDTGCVYGHSLSGLLLPERRVIQVPARRAYHPPTGASSPRCEDVLTLASKFNGPI